MSIDWIKQHKIKLSIITISIISILFLVYVVLRVKDDTKCKDGTTNMGGSCSKCITPCQDTNFTPGDGCICSCEQENGNDGLVFDKDDAVAPFPNGVSNISAELISDSSLQCKTENLCTADQLTRGFKDTPDGCVCPGGREPCTYNDTSGGDLIEVEYCCQDPGANCVPSEGEICCPTWMTMSNGDCCKTGKHVDDNGDCVTPCGIGVCPKTDDVMSCKFLVAPNAANCEDGQTLDDCLYAQWDKEQTPKTDKVVKLAVDKEGKNLSSYDSTSSGDSIKVLPYCLYGLEKPQASLLLGSTSPVSLPPLALNSWFSLNTDQSKILVPEPGTLNDIIKTQNYDDPTFKECAGQNNLTDHNGNPLGRCQFLLLDQLPTIIKNNKDKDEGASNIELIKTFMEEYIKNTIPADNNRDASIYGRYMMEDGSDKDPHAVKILIDKVPDSESGRKQDAANDIVRKYVEENNIIGKKDGPAVGDIVGVDEDGTFLAVIYNIDYDSPTDDLDAIIQRCKLSLVGEDVEDVKISPTPISSSTLPEQPYYPFKNPQDNDKIKNDLTNLRCTVDRQLVDIESSSRIQWVNTDGLLSNAKVPYAYGTVPWETIVGTKATWDPHGDPSIPTLSGNPEHLLYTSFGSACIPAPYDGVTKRTDFWKPEIEEKGITEKRKYYSTDRAICEESKGDGQGCYGIYMRGSDGTCNVSPCTNNGKPPVVNTTSHPWRRKPDHGELGPDSAPPPTWTNGRPDPKHQYFIQGKDACYRKVPENKIMDEKCDWANSWLWDDSKCVAKSGGENIKGYRPPNGTHSKDLGFAANCKAEGSALNPSCHGYAYDNLIQQFNIYAAAAAGTPYKWCMAVEEGPGSAAGICEPYYLADGVVAYSCNNDWKWYDINNHSSKNTISRSYDSREVWGGPGKPKYECKYDGLR